MTKPEIRDLDDMVRAHEYAGGFFFRSDSKRFFRSRIGAQIFTGQGGIFFTTSEQFEFRGTCKPRRYSVRKFDPDNPRSIETMGEFQAYATSKAAIAAAKRLAQGI